MVRAAVAAHYWMRPLLSAGVREPCTSLLNQMRVLQMLAWALVPGILACERSASHSQTSMPPSGQLSVDSLRCGARDLAGGCRLYDVSIIDLIARPAEFHGKVVRVSGFAHFEFEGNSLYLTRDDYLHGVYRNGLWLDPPTGLAPMADSLNDRYVLVEATFDALDQGHMGLWSGSLLNVSRMQLWERVDPLPERSPENASVRRPGEAP
jgi:hypothetical protein